jgi:hypothetical protein
MDKERRFPNRRRELWAALFPSALTPASGDSPFQRSASIDRTDQPGKALPKHGNSRSIFNMFYRALIIILFLQATFVLSANARTASIQGDVLGSDGRALKGAEVRVERKDKASPVMTASTNARGHYVVEGMSPGVYKISVVTGGAVKSAVNVKTTGDNARVDFDMQPASGKKVKHFVWAGSATGTNIGGRWVEVDDDSSAVAGSLNMDKASGEMARDLSRRQLNTTRP